jgi:hypothetical protein
MRAVTRLNVETAVSKLREMAGGRADLLGEAAGALGSGPVWAAEVGTSHASPRKGLKGPPARPAVLTGPTPPGAVKGKGGEGGSLGSSGWLSPDSVEVMPTGRAERCAADTSQSLAWPN